MSGIAPVRFSAWPGLIVCTNGANKRPRKAQGQVVFTKENAAIDRSIESISRRVSYIEGYSAATDEVLLRGVPQALVPIGWKVNRGRKRPACDRICYRRKPPPLSGARLSRSSATREREPLSPQN
jgi:hypothetical protein